MMLKKKFVWLGIVTLLAVISQATGILADTTGSLDGTVVLANGTPLAGAKVTASAPSETISTTTDAAGHFAFVSLIPDTYSVTVAKDGYETRVVQGVTVVAGNARTIRIQTQAQVKTLGVVPVRAAAALVRPGTTADVYSVNSSTQEKVATLGGGGSLTQAYSAIATVPGAVVPPGQVGWFQTVHIRGGDFDQIGYEFDGVPVLRGYDNYPATTAATLGQQELQVYTGAPPAESQNQGLAGYINQVVKSGTYPGFSNLTLGIGAPAFGNYYEFEVGGATPDRNFSYYLGSSINASKPRSFDQFNGAGYQQLWGAPLATCPAPPANLAACYVLGPPVAIGSPYSVTDRENVVNLHFGIPHRSDGGRDDIQLLYDVSYLNTLVYSSASDWGLNTPAFTTAYGFPAYPYVSGPPAYEYLGPVGAPLASQSNLPSLIQPVYFAYNPASVGPGPQFIPFTQRDGTANPNAIVKLQYQHNMGSNAYVRLYGFHDYSEWPQTCPNTGATNFIGYCPLNYYVRSIINGATLQFGDQINDRNLLTAQLASNFQIDYRANDTTMVNYNARFAWVVNANNPTAGVCYVWDPANKLGVPVGTPVSCFANAAAEPLRLASLVGTGFVVPPLPANCGGGPCEWWVAENGQRGGNNFAKPEFDNIAISDQIKVSDALQLNIGLREDRFFYRLSDTAQTPARAFWFNAWNRSYCVIPGGGEAPSFNPGTATNAYAGCPLTPSGIQTVPALLTNLPNDTETFWVFQPRLGATYTVGPDTVIRLSAARIDQAPNTAYEQYNLFQQNLASYDGLNFYKYGFTTTTHHIFPPTAQDYDLSFEHHFAGTETDLKLTPYYRVTDNQIQNFYLDQKTNFVSGLNVGRQTAEGVEFELRAGNFNNNGLSALLSYTYTYSFVKFKPLSYGGTVLDGINTSIQQYNAYTSACAGAAANTSTTSLCGAYGGTLAFPCFDPTTGLGTTSCSAADVANPYYNAPPQARLDPNGRYIPFGTLPGAIESAWGSYEIPHAATLVLNYKANKWSVSPQLQFFGGEYYGAPLTGSGVDPSSCKPLSGATNVTGDPRYPFGGTGAPYDATTCANTIAVPDPYTGVFDGMGVFRQPNQLLLHAQVSYEASPRLTFAVQAANIVDTCFGGTKAAWTKYANNQVCGYGGPGWGAPLPYTPNIYNPGQTFQPIVNFPYQEQPGILPFEASFSVKLSL